MKFLTFTVILSSLFPLTSCWSETLTYEQLRKDGIVSGFGVSRGNPLAQVDRIKSLDNPRYIDLRDSVYRDDTVCVGTLTKGGWRFTPLSVLNYHEIINHSNDKNISYCPLAGLAVSLSGDKKVSGLLKYDAFLLYDNRTDDLLLPYRQETYRDKRPFPLNEIQMLLFSGLRIHFPQAKILAPEYYRNKEKSPYGHYAFDARMGIGHPKPGLTAAYDEKKVGFRAKELVLVAGFNGRLQKAYPIAECAKKLEQRRGEFYDFLNGKKVRVKFDPEFQWVNIVDEQGSSLNLAYSYMFSLHQHLPSIVTFRN